MNQSNTAKCIVCGRQYKICLSCKKYAARRPWQNVADTPECYKLFLVLSQYNHGYLTKKEARVQLSQLTYQEQALKESIKNSLHEIMSDSHDTEKTNTKNSEG